MQQQDARETEHEITVAAPAESVYRLIADVTSWPRIFPPTVHVEYLERDHGELATGDDAGLLMSFEDTVRIDGSAQDVFDFLNEAQLWEKRLPHVRRVALTEVRPGLQVLEMDTSTKDGAIHTTRSVRVCFPHHRIVYKQIGLPALMTLHTGDWRLEPDGDAVSATSQHTVAINTATHRPSARRRGWRRGWRRRGQGVRADGAERQQPGHPRSCEGVRGRQPVADVPQDRRRP